MNDAEKDERVSRIIASCLREADNGNSVNPEDVIARHPECATELRSYFANKQLLGAALAGSDKAESDEAALPVSEQPTISPGAGDSVPSGAVSFRKLPTEFGRYRVERILGQGAMGAVYLAHDTNLGRDVALKTPKLSDVPDAESVERFRREARAAAVLHHRNLCPVFDVGEIQGVHFLTMAYIDGVPLSKAVSEDHPPTERQCATVVRKLAVALQEAHSHGVVHRDLKPANILMDRSREPVIMDFGLAYQMDQADRSRLTGEGIIMGSPAYMSPEQVTGEPSAVGPLADQYGLGVILFELLTGQLPVDGSTVAILAKILAGEQRRLRDVRPETDKRLAAICSRMMAQQSADRFPSMQAVADALGRWLKEQKLKSAKAGVVEDPTSWVVLYEEPLSKDPLPARQKKRKKRRKRSTAGSPPPAEIIQPLPETRKQPSTSPQRTSGRLWLLWLAAGFVGTAAVAGVIITLSDGTKIETTPSERVEITSDGNGRTSVTVQPANVADRSAAPATPPLDDAGQRPIGSSLAPGPHEILTSDEWTWSEPVFVGEFETHGNMTKVLSDDFQTWFQAVPQPGDTTEKPNSDIAWFTRTTGDERWSGPVLLDPPINGPSDERRPCVSPDGRMLVFQSNRPGGSGGRDDLWICERSASDGEWGPPVNLGPKVNSRKWEGQACFSPDSRTIYFSSDRRRKGSHLWATSRGSKNAAWTAAVEVPLGRNSPVRVMNPTLSSDNKVLIFNSNGEFGGEGEFDLWMCERQSPDVAWSAPRNLGLPVNSPGHEIANAISDDGKLLLFRRIPPGGKDSEGHGYWSVRRIRRSDTGAIAGTPVTPSETRRDTWDPRTTDAEGWTSLFNGRDLSGWHTVYSQSGVWRVENEEIVCRRKRSGEERASGWLATDEDYLNLELKLEYNMDPAGNSGIFLRAVPRQARNGADQLEVQLLDDTAPRFKDQLTEDKVTGAAYGVLPVSRRARAQPKKWNQMAVRLVGDQITVTVNGDRITDGDLRSANPDFFRPNQFDQPGPIGLQWHGTKVRFRNLRIRRLDAEGNVIPAGQGQPGKSRLFGPSTNQR